jgi:hypothetical protein
MFEFLSNRSTKKTLLAGMILTAVGVALAVLLPEKVTYLYLPGTLMVYALSGGAHGHSSGVYLPSLPVWYALAAPVNILFHALLLLPIIKSVDRVREHKPSPIERLSGTVRRILASK